MTVVVRRDECNVVRALARIRYSAATGKIAPNHVVAARALERERMRDSAPRVASAARCAATATCDPVRLTGCRLRSRRAADRRSVPVAVAASRWLLRAIA
ncbi:hypothetical protein WK25_22465 [Burkholderia latens]|nr:hypothetical protein WK25_22465 [Burkholderia latens]